MITDKTNFCKSYAEDYAALLNHAEKFKELDAKSRRGNRAELTRLRRMIAGLYWDMKEGLTGYAVKQTATKFTELNDWLIEREEMFKIARNIRRGGSIPKNQQWDSVDVRHEIEQKRIQLEELEKRLFILDAEHKEIRKMLKKYPRIDQE